MKASEFDHNNRLKRLEQKVNQLSGIIEAAGLLDQFVPLSLASRQLKINPWVIRERIKNDGLVLYGIHYKKNGNRYLVDVEAWQSLATADAKAKHH